MNDYTSRHRLNREAARRGMAPDDVDAGIAALRRRPLTALWAALRTVPALPRLLREAWQEARRA